MTRTPTLATLAAEGLADMVWYGGGGEDCRAVAEIVNRREEGWTLEHPGAMGHTVRTERVYFTDAELDIIAARADRILRAMARRP